MVSSGGPPPLPATPSKCRGVLVNMFCSPRQSGIKKGKDGRMRQRAPGMPWDVESSDSEEDDEDDEDELVPFEKVRDSLLAAGQGPRPTFGYPLRITVGENPCITGWNILLFNRF